MVFNSKVVAKAYVIITPVKVKKRSDSANNESKQQESFIQTEKEGTG